MKEIINYGEAKRQQILKGFVDTPETEEVEIEKARHGVYADNAQNRRLQRVGQEYGHAAKEEDPAAEGGEGGIPEGNVSLQNHARQASEEALVKVANDPSADAEMRKVATAELERRGVNVRAKNKKGDASLRNGLADGDAKAIKELAAAMKANPVDTGGAQSDATDDELADTIANMFEEAGVKVSKDGQKELDAMRGGEKESDTKQAEKAAEGDAKSAKKDADSNAGGSQTANKFIEKVLNGGKPEQYAKMFAKNPAEIASALVEQINSSDKRTASDAKFAAAQLAVFMDPNIRDSGIGKEISNHPELKEFVEEYDEARELTNGVYEDYKYRQAVMQQLNEFKRTRNGFVSKLLEIYGGKKDK